VIDPDSPMLVAFRAATSQSPHWKREYTEHVTVWPKANYGQAFRALAYFHKVSFSEMFRLLVEWEIERLYDEGELVKSLGLRKDLVEPASVGEDVVPDDLADEVRAYRDATIPGGAGEEWGSYDNWPRCKAAEGCDNLTPQPDEEFCGNHTTDEWGVREADCYCSMGHADNMDFDICHHHARVMMR